jgi:hypothetical protein
MAFFKAKLQIFFVQGLIIEYTKIVQKQLYWRVPKLLDKLKCESKAALIKLGVLKIDA